MVSAGLVALVVSCCISVHLITSSLHYSLINTTLISPHSVCYSQTPFVSLPAMTFLKVFPKPKHKAAALSPVGTTARPRLTREQQLAPASPCWLSVPAAMANLKPQSKTRLSKAEDEEPVVLTTAYCARSWLGCRATTCKQTSWPSASSCHNGPGTGLTASLCVLPVTPAAAELSSSGKAAACIPLCLEAILGLFRLHSVKAASFLLHFCRRQLSRAHSCMATSPSAAPSMGKSLPLTPAASSCARRNTTSTPSNNETQL